MKLITHKFADFPLLDYANTMQISGLILSGPERDYLIALPDEDAIADREKGLEVIEMDAAAWEKFLRQSDLLEVETGPLKAIVRKSQRQIDQKIAWTVYARDGFKCRYCGLQCPLTVDHIIPWEQGGPTIEANLLAACKPCNRERGNMPYDRWLDSDKYARRSRALHGGTKARNLLVALELRDLEKLAVPMAERRSR